MGPSGVGKSALGRALAARIGLSFLEGDDFHTAENRARMAAGVALTEEDRWPWLDDLGAALAAQAHVGAGAIMSCSCLRRTHRERLQTAAGEQLLFVALHAERALLQRRMAGRTGHFMPASLLDSQIALYEPPAEDEWHVSLPADQPLETLTASTIEAVRVGRIP